MDTDLRVTRGDTPSWLIAIVRDGTPVELDDATLTFTAKSEITDSDEAALISKELTPLEAGSARLQLDALDTAELAAPARYVYDVQLVEFDGTVTTILQGTLWVAPDVTRISAT